MTGFKHNATGRSTGKQSGSRGRRNMPPQGEQFGWITKNMFESPAWRALGINARKVLDRIMLEHLSHAGAQNGELICTYEDFQTYGVTRRYICAALEDLKCFGFIRITHGEPNGSHRPPNIYRLTWMGTNELSATNNWKGITDDHVKAREAQKRSRQKNRSPAPLSNETQCTNVAQSPALKVVK